MPSPEYLDLDFDQFQHSDIEKLKSMVTKHFKVYDIRWSEKTAAFYFNYNPLELEDKFEGLRLHLKNKGYIPRIAVENSEHIIYIVRKPKIKERKIWINVLLIILTIFTTTWAGSILWFGRLSSTTGTFNLFEPLFNPETVIFGFLSFALPLMLILGAHETAHYLAAKRHNIDASLPFFIPLPPPFILGTMGAFISMREPISNKKALLDIGAAGPIAGFIVSIPVLLIGFMLESMNPITITELPSQVYVFNEPLLFYGLRTLIPAPENSYMHPTVFAGWVGLFVTALNLIPGGQLDGGHIARALFGDYAKYISYTVVLILIILPFITGTFLWLFFAFIILFLGTSHPPPLNDISPLGEKRRVIGAFCVVMLLLCIHYSPMELLSIPDSEIQFECDNCNKIVDINGTVEYFIIVNNTGASDGNIEFSWEITVNNSNNSDWKTSFEFEDQNGNSINTINKRELKKGKYFRIIARISTNENVKYNAGIIHTLKVKLTGQRSFTDTYTLHTHVGTFDLNVLNQEDTVKAGDIKRCQIQVENLLDLNDTIDLAIKFTPPTKDLDWNVTVEPGAVQLGPKAVSEIILYITTPFNAKDGTIIELDLLGTSQRDPDAMDSVILIIKVERSR